jgi:hypothetical protein
LTIAALTAKDQLTMGIPVLTVIDARAAAREPNRYLLRIAESQARLFCEPGWLKLEPPRDGAVLFIHPQREVMAVRARGVL